MIDAAKGELRHQYRAQFFHCGHVERLKHVAGQQRSNRLNDSSKRMRNTPAQIGRLWSRFACARFSAERKDYCNLQLNDAAERLIRPALVLAAGSSDDCASIVVQI